MHARTAVLLALGASLLVPAPAAATGVPRGCGTAGHVLLAPVGGPPDVPELRPSGASLPALATAGTGACTPLAGGTDDAAVAGAGPGPAGRAPQHTDETAREVQGGPPPADAGRALTSAVGGDRERFPLPLALLAAGLLVLLAQSRVRDPALADVPVEAEPALDFEQFPRNGGGR